MGVFDDALKVAVSEQSLVESEVDASRFSLLTNPETLTLGFVDGGSATLFSAPQFHVSLLRIASVVYVGKKRSSRSIRDYQVLFTFEEGSVRMVTEPSSPLSNALFKTGDDEGRGLERFENLARRLLELHAALELSVHCEGVVLDGSLEAKTSEEEVLLEQLSTIMVIGFAKTSTLLLKNNQAITPMLLHAEPSTSPWHYSPLLKRSKIIISAAKLDEKSRHVFRIDSFSNPEIILSALLPLSADPTFKGYPYPLILTDKLARISKQEQALKQTKLQATYGKFLSPHKTALNAHSILDTLGE